MDGSITRRGPSSITSNNQKSSTFDKSKLIGCSIRGQLAFDIIRVIPIPNMTACIPGFPNKSVVVTLHTLG